MGAPRWLAGFHPPVSSIAGLCNHWRLVAGRLAACKLSAGNECAAARASDYLDLVVCEPLIYLHVVASRR